MALKTEKLKEVFGGVAVTAAVLGGIIGGPALIVYNVSMAQYKETGIKLDDESRVQAQQGRMTAEAACTEQEKMSRKLQAYFDREAEGAVSHKKLAAKNADFVITKAECLALVQQRGHAHSDMKP